MHLYLHHKYDQYLHNFFLVLLIDHQILCRLLCNVYRLLYYMMFVSIRAIHECFVKTEFQQIHLQRHQHFLCHHHLRS